MGRKGVSKRKPKKSKSGLIDNKNHSSSNARQDKSPSLVRTILNAKDAPPDRGGTNSSVGSNKKNRKGR